MATWDERVDAAIDDAARRMTEGEAAANFNARVMERVAAERSHRRWPSAWSAHAAGPRRHERSLGWLVWSPLAAAAMLVVAVILFRGVADERHASREHASLGDRAAAESQNARAAAGRNGPGPRPDPDAARENARARRSQGSTVPGAAGQAAATDRATRPLRADAAAVRRRDRAAGRPMLTRSDARAARQLDATNDASLDALAPPRLEITPLTVSPLETAAVAADALRIPQLDSIPPITIAPLAGEDSQRRFQ